MHSTLRTALLGLALVFPTAGCGSSRDAAPPGHVTLEGRLIDAETGEPISRDGMFVHLFCDDLDVQNSLEREDTMRYRAIMPGRTIRVRVFDPSRTYHRFEETITVAGAERRFDIALQPTGYVTLHGRAVIADSGQVIIPDRGAAIGAGGPLFYIGIADGSVRDSTVSLDATGRYSLKVPRATIRIDSVNSALSPIERTLDLTGYEADAFEYDIRMQ